MNLLTDLPDDFPQFLRHSDDDTPTPTWEQITRSAASSNSEFIAHLSRILSNTEDEQVAMEVWDAWPGNCRRSVALLVDKIYHEGWLDSVGPIKEWPWDGGFFFWPHHGHESLIEMLNSKSGKKGTYTRCSYRVGVPAGLARWDHKAWKWSWIETDSPMASLHVGVFRDGSAEVHLDLFNPLYINGSPRSEVTRLPVLGAFNRKLFRLHRRWERSRYASIARTSANFYHLMLGQVPLSF
jgi:hypothetical protein